jgi:hypothetical protein
MLGNQESWAELENLEALASACYPGRSQEEAVQAAVVCASLFEARLTGTYAEVTAWLSRTYVGQDRLSVTEAHSVSQFTPEGGGLRNYSLSGACANRGSFVCGHGGGGSKVCALDTVSPSFFPPVSRGRQGRVFSPWRVCRRRPVAGLPCSGANALQPFPAPRQRSSRPSNV